MIIGRWNVSTSKVLLCLGLLTLLIMIINIPKHHSQDQPHPVHIMLGKAWDMIRSPDEDDLEIKEHVAVVAEFYNRRQNMNLTQMGRILFLNEPRPPARNKIYKIYVYLEGKDMEERQLYFFSGTRHEPFELCSVSNCVLSYEETDMESADAVMFHLHRFNKDYNIPRNVTRHPSQRWIFNSDESPHHTFMLQSNDWFNYTNVFNWSMLYRILPLDEPLRVPKSLSFSKKMEALVPYAKEKRRDVLVAILSSNCHANKRIDYIEQLQKYIDVDVYGGCAPERLKTKCLWKGYGTTCEVLRKYVFYLSFLNSNCNGYMSEKLYTHGLSNGGIPVFMGMHKNESDIYIPPGAYIHINDFKSPEELAKYLLHINETFEENYLKFHEWRKHFKSVGEDGYMGAQCFHYCRICEALNFNDEAPKVYNREDLAFFLDPHKNCYPPTW